MNGHKIFIDTNIAIYLLQGDESLAEILNEKQIHISFITQLELLSYPKMSPSDATKINELLNHFTIIDINSNIKDATIKLRRKYKLKLPDSIIAATTLYLDLPIITADKNFQKVKELDLLIYEN